MAATALARHPSGADVEIIECHHRYKEDAPSGTALKFGEIIADAMGQTEHRHGRAGRPGKRPHDEIGYHALRAGDDPGRHTILFGLLGRNDRAQRPSHQPRLLCPRRLTAAKFLAGKPAGLYNMADVLEVVSSLDFRTFQQC